MREIKIVFEDDYLIIVDKPPKLLVVSTPRKEKYTLTFLVNEILAKRQISFKAHPCHRIDRETSGLVVYAKGKKNQQAMMCLFKERRIKKTYIGFVHGHLQNVRGVIKKRIESKEAITKYALLEKRKNFSVFLIYPITGRKNQIRIHFKGIGHPLVGERRFAFARDFCLKFRRAALHALGLEFRHPVTDKLQVLKIPLADDMQDFLNKN